MLWIYVLVVVLVTVITYPVFRFYSLRKLTAGFLSGIFIVIAVLLTHLFFMPYNVVCTYESKIKSQSPFFDLIKAKSPNEYNTYISKIKANISAKGDLSNEIYYQSEFLNALLVKYGPNASNQSLYDYLKSSVDYDRKLYQIDPALVLYHEFPEKFTNQKVDFKNLNVDEYKNTVLNSTEDVITSGIAQLQPAPTADETKKAMMIFRDVVGNISKKYGSKLVISVLQQPNNPLLDKNQAADIVIALMDGIVAKGKDDAALFLRTTLMLNRPKQ